MQVYRIPYVFGSACDDDTADSTTYMTGKVYFEAASDTIAASHAVTGWRDCYGGTTATNQTWSTDLWRRNQRSLASAEIGRLQGRLRRARSAREKSKVELEIMRWGDIVRRLET